MEICGSRKSRLLIVLMFFDNRSRDNQPFMRIGNFPIGVTTLLVGLLVCGMIVTALLGPLNSSVFLDFSPEAVWRRGQIWRIVSYLAVGQVGFFTIFNLLFVYSFGRDCEQELSRARYLVLLAILIATPVVVVSVLWLLGVSGFLMGSTPLSIGLVIAFATIYPNAEWWGGIPMKFVAIGSMFLAAVGAISSGDQMGLLSTLITCAVSYGYLQGLRSQSFNGWRWPDFLRPRPKFRILPSPSPRPQSSSETDDLLDKIARSGFDSLTAKERATLEAARLDLIQRDRR